MARRRRLFKRYKKNPSEGGFFTSGTAMSLTEIAGWMAPGFAAFGAARFGTYLITGQIEKRKPSWGKHAGAIAAVGTFVAAWMVAHRIRFLSKYVEPIVIGTGLAGIQSLLQIYVPKLGWMVGDPMTAASDPQLAAPTSIDASLPPGFSVVDDESEFDLYNGGIFPGQTATPQTAQQAQPSAAPAPADLTAELDDEQSIGGIFG